MAGLGLYVWHEASGWRVRLTHNLPRVEVNGVSRPQLVEVRGQITTSRPVARVRTVRLEDRQAGEWVSVHRPKRKVVEFRFVNGGFIDGVDFTAGCAGRVGLTVWQVNRDATGKVTGRTPLPVYVGAARTQVDHDERPGAGPLRRRPHEGRDHARAGQLTPSRRPWRRALSAPRLARRPAPGVLGRPRTGQARTRAGSDRAGRMQARIGRLGYSGDPEVRIDRWPRTTAAP